MKFGNMLVKYDYHCSAYRRRGLTPIKLYLINTNFVEITKLSK